MNKTFICAERLEYVDDHKIFEFYCGFNSDYYYFGLFGELGVVCPDEIRDAGILRQAEFLAGRYAAKQVLKAHCLPNKQIGINRNRSPIWPNSIVGSISHTSDEALCSAGYREAINDIGVDIEPWFTASLAQEIKQEVLNTEEMKKLSKLNIPFHKTLTLCFSAKESLYKALAKYRDSSFGFRKIEVVHISLRNKTISLRVIDDLSTRLMSGDIYKCWFTVDEKIVLTRAILTRDQLSN